MSYRHIDFCVEQSVATLRLDRPDRLNSLNAEMLDEIIDALDVVGRDGSIRCLLLTGNGRGFCAGQDLKDRVCEGKVVAPDLSESLEKRYNPIVRSITSLPLPVVCAVNGVAAGAGANLALACDVVVAARSASFIQAFCKIGLIPDAGGTWTLPRLVGRARAVGLSMLGDSVSAEQAAQWGMIWKMVEDDQLMEEASALVSTLCERSTPALGLIKRAISQGAENTLDQQLDLERTLQGEAVASGDYFEGVTAFLEKRPPRFGRQP